MKLFVNGRKGVFDTLKAKITTSDKTIWFHAASLGEYEQGLPVMEQIKIRFPNHKIVLTFFSPSGYEVRKNNQIADVTVYLPLDSKANAKKFVETIAPEMVFFIKYEFWIQYLTELKKRQIPVFLVSGIFRTDQPFFKWYGGFYRKALLAFDHFFVQNESSKKLIQSIGYHNVTVSGDTRFDRVAAILERDNSLTCIEEFLSVKSSDMPVRAESRTENQNEPLTSHFSLLTSHFSQPITIVAGSTWEKDEELLIHYINQSSENVKFVIAPHNIHQSSIGNLQSSIKRKTVLFSEKEGENLSDYQVFIIDTIGILTKIYSYADIAYVGGGFGNPGVHNILEPAVFGIPVVVGKNYSHFAEASALVQSGGCISVNNQTELSETFDRLLQNPDERSEKGHICGTFVTFNKGASEAIMKHIECNFNKKLI